MRSESEYLRRIQEDGIKLKNPGTIDIGTVDQGAAGAAAWPVTFSSTSRTPTSTVVSTSGTVSSGKQSVYFVPSSDFTGTLLGAAWPGTNLSVGFAANVSDTIGAIVYTRTAGSLTILTLT